MPRPRPQRRPSPPRPAADTAAPTPSLEPDLKPSPAPSHSHPHPHPHSHPHPHPHPNTRSHLFALLGRVRLVGWIAVVVLMLSTAAVVLWGLTGAAPSWWKPLNLADPKVNELAQTVENQLANAAHAYRGRPTASPAQTSSPARTLVTGEPWTITVTTEQANAWLNTRLPQWIEGRDDAIDWPAELTLLQVDFSDGLVRVGVLAQAAEASQYFSASLVPAIREGALWLEVDTLALGRLSLPAGWFISALADDPRYISAEVRRDERTQRLLDALAGRRTLTDNPSIPLSDGRRVRLLSVRVLPGAIELRCQTEVQQSETAPTPSTPNPDNPSLPDTPSSPSNTGVTRAHSARLPGSA